MSFIVIWIFFFFLGGELLCLFLNPNYFFLVFSGVSSLFVSFIFYKRRKLFLSDFFILLLFFFLGALWFKPYNLKVSSPFLKEKVKVIGKIIEAPFYYSNYALYKIRSNHISLNGKQIYFPGSILVKDYSLKKVSVFDVYMFEGNLRKNFYKRRGYILYLKKDKPAFKVRVTKDIRKIPFLVSEKISWIFKESFPKPISTFILAIFLGKREEYFPQIKKIFVEAGTCHILAISGLHIGIISAVFLFILKFIGFKKRSRLFLALPLVLFYAFLSGARPPVLRAAFMFLIYSLSIILKRKFLLFNSLALAGLGDLFFRPDDFLTIGFQFSFLAVFSIAIGFKYFYSPKKLTFLEKARILFLTSLFANLGLTGIISFYFGKIYLLSLLINILVIPYLGLIFYSLFVFLTFFFIEPLGKFVVLSCSFIIWLFLRINQFFSNLPWSYLNYKASLGEVFLYYVFFLVILLLVDLRKKRKILS